MELFKINELYFGNVPWEYIATASKNMVVVCGFYSILERCGGLATLISILSAEYDNLVNYIIVYLHTKYYINIIGKI